MNTTLSQNMQSILLLTAPLITGRNATQSDMLTPGEYKRLHIHLRDMQRQPGDLLSPEADELLNECRPIFDDARLKRLLARGFLLSQAIERWRTRAIRVIGQDDDDYPKRFNERLKNDAPPILYSCGDAAILNTGGLAIVGSRNVDDALIEYTEGVGRLAAESMQTLISGGARGIDQAAMRGALEAGGKVAGVLADSLERTAMNRDHRNMLLDGRLALISPYDPNAGFNVGHAMQRNKLIYALADAALVVSSDINKGGTWAGATEQLDKLKFTPIYIRAEGASEKGLAALRAKGALPWPNPRDTHSFVETITPPVFIETETGKQNELSFATPQHFGSTHDLKPNPIATPSRQTKIEFPI